MTTDRLDLDCSHCLPDCVNTLYSPSITTTPFRPCENTNLGVT
jgi:hypothetical protein